MIHRFANLLLLSLFLVMATAVSAAEQSRLRADKTRVNTKNAFADSLLKLHYAQLDGRKVEKKQQQGGYATHPDFYNEESFYDAATGRLLSVVQWEKDEPTRVHALEVYIHDKLGRVIRDYGVTYLPMGRNAPFQTLVSLHVYNGDYHAFRTFDAFGERVYERCEKGEEIVLHLDEDQIIAALRSKDSVMTTPQYQTCFANLDVGAGKYLTPQ